MPRPLRWLFGMLILAVLVGGPLAYYSYRYRNFRNFHVVTPGVLYRSGQLSQQGLEQVLHDYEIKTIVTLRDAPIPGNPPPDRAEEEYCRKMGIKHVRLAPQSWSAPDGSVPAAANVQKFLEVVSDPNNHPVLVHCFAGAHRTGACVAVYRLECQRWSTEQTLEEMRTYGYDNLDEEWDILGYLEGYGARLHCKSAAEEAEPRSPSRHEE